MKHAALDFRAHSGWTALVAISLEGDSPLVILREHPHLVKTFTYEFRQPYHTAGKRPPPEAQDFISRARADARRLSYRVIHSVQTNLYKQGYELRCCGLLLASGKPLPGLSQILASHALIHAADGELFREALLHASKRSGVESFTAKESDYSTRAPWSLWSRAPTGRKVTRRRCIRTSRSRPDDSSVPGRVFNALNHLNFNDPQTSMSGSGFGSITTAADSRIGQLALKLRF